MKTLLRHKCLQCWQYSRSVHWDESVHGYLCNDEDKCLGNTRFLKGWADGKQWPDPTETEDTIEIVPGELDDGDWPSRYKSQNRKKPRWTWCNECARWTETRWLHDGYYCAKCRTTSIIFTLSH